MKKLLFSVILMMCMLIAVFAQDVPEGLYNEITPELSAPPQHKWGDDILITNQNIGGMDFATDYNSGSIYAYQNTSHNATSDTCFLYKSADNGLTWTKIGGIQLNENGDISDPEIIITDAGKVACVSLNIETTGERVIRMREFTDTTLMASIWEYPTTAADTVIDYDIDYSDGYYYLTYTVYDASGYWDICGVTCHEDSNTWTNHTNLFDNAFAGAEPRISAGTGGYGYIAFIENRLTAGVKNIRCKRTYNYGDLWIGSVPITTDLSGQDISDIDIACSKLQPEIVWTTVQFNDFSTWGYYLSTDACSTSNYEGVIAAESGYEESYGTVESHPVYGWATFAFKSDSASNHNVAFFYIDESAPANVRELQIINDHLATGTYRPVAGNIMLNSAIMYAGWGPTNLYFDTYANNLGIDERIAVNDFNVYASPAVFHDETDIFFVMNDNSNVTVEIFNTLGQRVWSYSSYFAKGINSVKWSGADSRGSNVPEGLYFFRVNSGSAISSGKIILF